MKKLYLLALMAIVAVSCQREVGFIEPTPSPSGDVVQETTSVNVRSYDEALAIAEEALQMVDDENTRSSNRRRIMRNSGQVVSRPVTRGGEDAGEQPIMYIFNNENNEGFTIVAADRSQQALVAVTEQGNYTYGEPTGVEPFDAYMNNVTEKLSIFPDSLSLPGIPLIPTPAVKADTVYYNRTIVGPIITTKWGQTGIYGNLCSNGVSGCGSTAIAQIVAHHRHPAYLTQMYLGINNVEMIAMDWENILRHIENIGAYNEELNKYVCRCGCNYDQISLLMREIGCKAGATYNQDDLLTPANELGTITYDSGCRNAFMTLGYGDVIWAEYIALSEYQSIIYNEIDNDRPIYISAFPAGSLGHVWVIDGYDHKEVIVNYFRLNPYYSYGGVEPQYILDFTDVIESNLLHFNWGWNGNCNGWFSYGCLNPNEGSSYDSCTESNHSSYNFIRGVSLIYNIKPTN